MEHKMCLPSNQTFYTAMMVPYNVAFNTTGTTPDHGMVLEFQKVDFFSFDNCTSAAIIQNSR